MIRCKCPHCEATYSIQDEFAGRKLRCAACHKVFRGSTLKPPPVPVAVASGFGRSWLISGALSIAVAIAAGVGLSWNHNRLEPPAAIAAPVAVTNEPVSKPAPKPGPRAERAANYEVALERAKATGKDIAVFQRGSDWNLLAERLYRDVWLTDDFAASVGDQVILVAVDSPEVVGGIATVERIKAAPMPPNEVTAVASEGGATLTQRDDGAWLASGTNPAHDTLTLTLKTISGGDVLRIDFPTDASLPGTGPGRASNGNFAISEFECTPRPIAGWASATETDQAIWKALDGISDKTDSVWNPAAHHHQLRTVLLALQSPVPAGAEVTVKLICRSQWGQHVPGCVRAAIVSQGKDDVVAVADAEREQARNQKFAWWDRTYCPRIALMDSDGRGVACENKPRAGMDLAARVRELRDLRKQRDALWATAESATGPARAELLRQSLDLLSMANSAGPNDCYKPIHEQIRAADPQDESGAVRWLGFGGGARGGVPWARPNWSEALAKKDLTDADYHEALARIEKELSDPRNRILSHEYIQRMMIARFHVYKRWPGHEEQCFDVQREIATFDPTTFWGIGAIGYLAMHHRTPTPMLTYGWDASQMKSGANRWELTDTAYFFDHAGPYKLRLNHTGGKGTVKIERIAFDGKEVHPDAELGPKNKFVEVDLNCTGNHPGSLFVDIEATEGQTESAGNFSVEPQLLPPATADKQPALDVAALQQKLTDTLLQEVAKGAGGIGHILATPALRANLAQHEVIRACTADKVADIAKRDGGTAFLQAFFADTSWMESFLASDPADLPQALENLRLLSQYNDDLNESLPQRIATALALQWGLGSRYRLVDRDRDVRRAWHEGLLHSSFEKLTVREMRWAIPTYGTAKDYQFLLDERQTRLHDYLGACWAIAYVDPNVYGDSVQHWTFIAPWTHHYGTGTGNRPFAAHRLVGGVCGTLSGYGAAVTQAHGVPSTTIGQPGHCAYVVRLGESWPVGNSVAGPEATGFSAPGWEGTSYATAAQLYESVESDRKAFLQAQRTVWLGRLKAANWQAIYELAIAAQPTNFVVWLDYIKALEAAKDTPAKTWLTLARRAARNFAFSNEAGWALTRRCLDKALPSMTPAERMAVLVDCNQELCQKNWKNPMSWRIGNVLNWQADRIGDPALAIEFFSKLLTIHHSQDASQNWIFANVLGWGSARFASQPGYPQAIARFFKSLGDTADQGLLTRTITTGIRKASEADDLASYRQWTQMAAEMLPPLHPRDIHLNDAQAAAFPKYEPFPGELLSSDGMLRTSSACQYDRPLSYARLLSGGIGGWFDTNNESNPWAQVRLAGECKLSGIVLVNRYEYAPTQEEFQWAAPLKVSVSSDGKSWQEVQTFPKAEPLFRVDLSDRDIQARYVRIERIGEPGQPPSNGRFHFRSFLVYGQKLY